MSLFFKAALLLKRWELNRNSKLSRAQLQAKQLLKFRRLVTYANKRSRYYSRLIKSRSIDISVCVPEDFPVLTKTEVMEHFDDMVTDARITKKAISAFLERSRNPADLFLGQFHIVHTSGSSGEVGVFVFSSMDWARGFAQIGRNNPLPSPFKPLRYACFFAADGHYAGASWATTLKRLSTRQSENILIIDINTPIAEVMQRLNNFQPDVLAGYPSGTLLLAALQKQGRLAINPSRIILSGEVATDQEIRSIAGAFGSYVANSYNCSEHMAMGATHPGSSRIRLWEDDLIFDIRQDHTIVTNLFNRTLPLIRYRMADSLILQDHDDPHPYRCVAGVVGRRENAPLFTNEFGAEDFISPHVISEIYVPGVARFQMQVISRTAFRFAACLSIGKEHLSVDDAIAGLTSRLKSILKNKQMTNVKFEIVLVEQLFSDPKSGKFRLVVGFTSTRERSIAFR